MSSSTSDTDAERSEEDYSSDTLSLLEKNKQCTSSWDKSFLSSLNISSLLRNPGEFIKPCDLILQASFCSMSETKLREGINKLVERVNRLEKEIESNPPDAFSFISTSNVEDFTVNSIFPMSNLLDKIWNFSNTLQQTEPEFCKKFSNGATDFIAHLQNLIRCYQRKRIRKDDSADDEDQGNRKRKMAHEPLETSDVPEQFYEQLFISFAKMCGVFALRLHGDEFCPSVKKCPFVCPTSADPEEQNMQIKGYPVSSQADILLVDFSCQTPKQRMLAVVEVKKPKREKEGRFTKKKRETRRQTPDCYTHFLNDEPELVGQHGGEMLLYSPNSIFNDNGVIGIIVHGTIVTFCWLKMTQHQFKQMSRRKIQTTAEIKYSHEYNYFTEEGRIEVIKALFMLSLIGKLKYEFPKACSE